MGALVPGLRSGRFLILDTRDTVHRSDLLTQVDRICSSGSSDFNEEFVTEYPRVTAALHACSQAMSPHGSAEARPFCSLR